MKIIIVNFWVIILLESDIVIKKNLFIFEYLLNIGF